MKTIEVQMPIPVDRILTMPVPATAEPGDEIHVQLTASPSTAAEHQPLDLPLHHVGPWPADVSLRREDIYGDDGR